MSKIEQAARILEAAQTQLAGIQMIRDEPHYHRLLDADRSITDALRKAKAAAFEWQWTALRNVAGLQNAEEDEQAQGRLLKAFLKTPGLDYKPLVDYLQERKPQANELATAAILKQARKAVPRLPNGQWRSRDVTDDDILHGKRVQLRVYRGGYHNEQLSLDTLDALEKLAYVTLWARPAGYVKATKLRKIYRYRYGENNHDGKRAVGGPITHARSYKNNRFDLWFKTEDDAREFAEALTEEP